MLQYPCDQITYKKINKFASEISKHNRSGELDMEEAPHIEECENPEIQ